MAAAQHRWGVRDGPEHKQLGSPGKGQDQGQAGQLRAPSMEVVLLQREPRLQFLSTGTASLRS